MKHIRHWTLLERIGALGGVAGVVALGYTAVAYHWPSEPEPTPAIQIGDGNSQVGVQAGSGTQVVTGDNSTVTVGI